jgi:hypothetical protein
MITPEAGTAHFKLRGQKLAISFLGSAKYENIGVSKKI